MNNSVVAILQAAGLYKESGRMAEQTLKTILPDGQVTEHLMSEIEYADLKTMADELDIMISQENPWIQALFAKNAVAIANAIRVVNVESASGFKGAVGSGRQLDILRFRAEQFQAPSIAGISARATWDYNEAGAPLARDFIVNPDGLGAWAHADLAMGTTEAILIFGFANPSWWPCTSAIQLTYLARVYNIQNADFNLAQIWEHFPLIELKEPFVLYPREDGRVRVYYNQIGDDLLQPVGLWVKMSQNLRAMAPTALLMGS